MADTNSRYLKEVKTDWEEMETRIRKHRRKRRRRIILAAVCIAACLVILYIALQVKTYGDYRVADSTERSDTQATEFLEMDGNILKYSNDGAMYTTKKNEMIWNQTFEMENPLVAVRGEYAAFADTDGQEVYILDESGFQVNFETEYPIRKIDISSQGTAAVLMADESAGYLALYDDSGECLAEGAIYMENSGYPMDIALTDDGKNLAVTILDVASGSVSTTVTFYNFDSEGEDETDHIVSTYTYADCVIPQIECPDGGVFLAFSDSGVIVYEGSQTPEESERLSVTGEIKSVFYDDSYFGLVVSDEEEGGRTLIVYNLKCSEVMRFSLDVSYDEIYFLENHEVCVQSAEHCEIYTVQGIKKFAADFEEEDLYYVLSKTGSRRYIFVLEGSSEQVCLKLFSTLEEE